jgi:toxin ParE1/3/4
MKARYSPRATADIIAIAIADYLTERNRAAAHAVEGAIRRAIDLLSEFPGNGRVLTQRSNVRVIPVVRYPYLIFYTANSNEVLFLHIRHGARAPVKPEEL